MKLSQKEFERLMKKVEDEESDLTGTIAMGIRTQFYSIGFYGECKNAFESVVDEFHKLVKGEWKECDPTEYQRLVMQAKLIDKRKELEEEQSRLNEPVLEDNYENLGLKPSDFY